MMIYVLCHHCPTDDCLIMTIPAGELLATLAAHYDAAHPTETRMRATVATDPDAKQDMVMKLALAMMPVEGPVS